MLSTSMQIRPNHLCALGLTPFLLRYLDTRSLSCLLIYSNGIIFHVFFPHNFYMRWFDVCCNAVLTTYINLYVMNIYVTMWSLYGTICFIYNVPIPGYELLEPMVHIVFVQGSAYRALVLAGF